jgi:hypothetical protein
LLQLANKNGIQKQKQKQKTISVAFNHESQLLLVGHAAGH